MNFKMLNDATEYTLSDSKPVFCGNENKLILYLNDGENPQKTEFRLRFKNGDSYSVWSPLYHYKRFLFPTWRTSADFEFDANHGLPLVQFIDKAGNNILLIALSDIINPVNIRAGIDERTGMIEIKISLFTKPMPLITENYSVGIFSCNEHIPYYEAIACAMEYLRKKNNAFPMVCPNFAKRRTYSTWYAFQKDVSADAVLKQCRLAKQYGMDSMILDDGWQTSCSQGESNAYSTCGDWENYTSKFPDMKKFSDEIHSIGMKFILWFATPFIGRNSKEFEFFKGKLLRCHSGDGSVWIADPRFSEIRYWYIKKLTKMFTEWNLDGFKLDFIDCFTLGAESSCDYTGMDIPSLAEAVFNLTEEIRIALQKINPDVVIEYRQEYIGPAMQKNGNMIRVGDCAYGAMYNRVNGIDLRLVSGENAVHSDMLMWDYNASAEGCADQLSNLLFVVPQISMYFDKLKPEHKRVLKFYLDFIDNNSDVLQDGKLVPLYPEALYPVIYAYSDKCLIAGLYESESFVVPQEFETVKIVNATGKPKILVDLEKSVEKINHYTVYNCMGDIIFNGTIINSVAAYNVPHNGIIVFS